MPRGVGVKVRRALSIILSVVLVAASLPQIPEANAEHRHIAVNERGVGGVSKVQPRVMTASPSVQVVSPAAKKFAGALQRSLNTRVAPKDIKKVPRAKGERQTVRENSKFYIAETGGPSQSVASGKVTVNKGKELYANFSRTADGGVLAVVESVTRLPSSSAEDQRLIVGAEAIGFKFKKKVYAYELAYWPKAAPDGLAATVQTKPAFVSPPLDPNGVSDLLLQRVVSASLPMSKESNKGGLDTALIVGGAISEGIAREEVPTKPTAEPVATAETSAAPTVESVMTAEASAEPTAESVMTAETSAEPTVAATYTSDSEDNYDELTPTPTTSSVTSIPDVSPSVVPGWPTGGWPDLPSLNPGGPDGGTGEGSPGPNNPHGPDGNGPDGDQPAGGGPGDGSQGSPINPSDPVTNPDPDSSGPADPDPRNPDAANPNPPVQNPDPVPSHGEDSQSRDSSSSSGQNPTTGGESPDRDNPSSESGGGDNSSAPNPPSVGNNPSTGSDSSSSGSGGDDEGSEGQDHNDNGDATGNYDQPYDDTSDAEDPPDDADPQTGSEHSDITEEDPYQDADSSDSEDSDDSDAEDHPYDDSEDYIDDSFLSSLSDERSDDWNDAAWQEEQSDDAVREAFVQEYVAETGHCPNPGMVDDLPNALKEAGYSIDDVITCLKSEGEPADAESGSQDLSDDAPAMCPTSEEGAELEDEMLQILQKQAAEIKEKDDLIKKECEAKKDEIKRQVHLQQTALNGMRHNLYQTRREIRNIEVGILTGLVARANGFLGELQTHEKAQVELVRAQIQKLDEMTTDLKLYECEDIDKYKAIFKTPEIVAADEAFRTRAEQAMSSLDTTEAVLKGTQKGLVGGAAVLTVVMSGGTTAPVLLLQGAGAGTAIGLITESSEAVSNVANDRMTAGEAAFQAGAETLEHAVTATTTTVGTMTGGAVTRSLSGLVQGAKGWRVVLFSVSAKTVGGATGGATSASINLVPVAVTGQLTPTQALESLGLSTLLGALGGAFSSDSVVKDLAGNAAILVLTSKITGNIDPKDIAENAVSLLTGYGSSKKCTIPKNPPSGPKSPGDSTTVSRPSDGATNPQDPATNPDSNPNGGTKPGEPNPHQSSPQEGDVKNFEILPALREYFKDATDALPHKDGPPPRKDYHVANEVQVRFGEKSYRALQEDGTFSTFYYLRAADFNEVASGWLNQGRPANDKIELRDTQTAVRNGSITIIKIPEKAAFSDGTVKFTDAELSELSDIRTIKEVEAEGKSQFQAYHKFFTKKFADGGQQPSSEQINNATVRSLLDAFAANTDTKKYTEGTPQEWQRQRRLAEVAIKQLTLESLPAEVKPNSNRPIAILIRNLNSMAHHRGPEALERALVENAEHYPDLADTLFEGYAKSEFTVLGRDSAEARVGGAKLSPNQLKELRNRQEEVKSRAIQEDPQDRAALARENGIDKLSSKAQMERIEEIAKSRDLLLELALNSPFPLPLGKNEPDVKPVANKQGEEYWHYTFEGGNRPITAKKGSEGTMEVVTMEVVVRYHTKTSKEPGLPNYRVELSDPLPPDKTQRKTRWEMTSFEKLEEVPKGATTMVVQVGKNEKIFVKMQRQADNNNPDKIIWKPDGDLGAEDRSKVMKSVHIEYVPEGMDISKR